MGKRKNNLTIKFDTQDRVKFLKNQGQKYSKQERRKYLEKQKINKKRKERKEHNKMIRQQVEEKYEELIKMQKEMNKYADLSSESEDEEEKK